MKNFMFTVVLSGDGNTPEEAWRDAIEAFMLDPGEPSTECEITTDEDDN